MYSNRRSEAATSAAVTSLKNRIVVNKTKIRLVAHFAMLARQYHNACQTILSFFNPFMYLFYFPGIYVHFHTFQDFGTSEVEQVTKDDENLKCWKVSQAKVCQQLRGYISAMQAMSDEGEKIEIDKVCVLNKLVQPENWNRWKWRNREEMESPNIRKFTICSDLGIFQC